MARPRKDKVEPDYDVLQSQPGEHVPSLHKRGKIIEFVCAGFTQEQIASYFNVSTVTLNKYYYKELHHSMQMRTSKLARNLFVDALKGCKQSREFWLKTRARWYVAVAPKDDERENKMDALLEKLIDKL